MRLFPLIGLLFLLVGCEASSREIAQRVEYALPCSIQAGGTTIGGGVVLGPFMDAPQCALLTARHVVTYNREYLHSISIVFADRSEVSLGSTKDVWLTVPDKSVDCAWLLLDGVDTQRLTSGFTDYKIPVCIGSTPVKDDVMLIVNARDRHSCRYVEELAIKDVPFDKNLTFREATLRVGIVDVATEESESGSPVFKIINRCASLVGTTSISRKAPDGTGYIALPNVLPSISSSILGEEVHRLVDFPDLW